MFYVYILKSAISERYYIGHTEDIILNKDNNDFIKSLISKALKGKVG
jgi:hypothetical protein